MKILNLNLVEIHGKQVAVEVLFLFLPVGLQVEREGKEEGATESCVRGPRAQTEESLWETDFSESANFIPEYKEFIVLWSLRRNPKGCIKWQAHIVRFSMWQ